MTASRAELLLGADYEGDENFCHNVVNAIKNHFRVSNPCVAMTERQPGEILSDPDDDRIYHVGGESGHPCDEILQETRSCAAIPEFKGVDYYDACNGDYATIRGIDEPGLGHRLTIGLDETTRTMVICDLGDIDVDLGLAANVRPTLYIYNNDAVDYSFLNARYLHINSGALQIESAGSGSFWMSNRNSYFRLYNDLSWQGDAFIFDSEANVELTDDNTEQRWIYVEPKINQTSTAGYIAILVDVTETSLGDGSAGAGYNALLDLRVSGTTQFGIQNGGEIMTNQVEAGAIAAYDRRIPIYDGAGNFEGYVALYASP